MKMDTYFRWRDYYDRNCGHPLAVPLTLGLGNQIASTAAGDKRKLKPGDYAVFAPKKHCTGQADANNADNVEAILEALSDGS